MAFNVVLRGLLPAALCLIALAASAAHAEDGADYTISGEDGYGIMDCMHSGNACGRVIADSWCESHGHAHALAYGMGSDVTGSVGGSPPVVNVAASDVVIRCGD